MDFSPREVIAAMVDRGFPTTLYQAVTDPGTGKTIQVPVKDAQGNTVQSKEALRMKQELIDGLSALELPENSLDQLVNHFGERRLPNSPAEHAALSEIRALDSCSTRSEHPKA